MVRRHSEPTPVVHNHRVTAPAAISIVIPAYNEEGNIEFVVNDCVETLRSIPGTHEIVVVDDASTDSTPHLLTTLAQQHANLRVLTNDANIGCHPSLRRGFDAARGDWLLFLPADRQIRASVLPAFLAASESAAMVCSYRRRRSDPVYRVWVSRLYNAIARLATGVPFRDFDSSIFVRRDAYLSVAPGLIAESASLSVELLVRILARGHHVTEVEIEHFPRVAGRNSGLNWRDSVRVPVNLLRSFAIVRRARGSRSPHVQPNSIRAAKGSSRVT